jgi:two-component system chemotaxis response regulator CheB
MEGPSVDAFDGTLPKAAPAAGVVAIGASAGGVEALQQLAANLASDLPFAVMVTVHMRPAGPSMLAAIIDRAGPLPAATATDGAVLQAGHIYVAPPDQHLLAHDHRAVLGAGPRENGHRPAINALFRSVALDYGPRVIGVVLSGLLDDGVAGLAAIRDCGGVTVVQEPSDALFPDMPQNAVKAGVAQHQLAAREIGGRLKQLANPDGLLELENRIAMSKRFAIAFESEDLGPPSTYTCP